MQEFIESEKDSWASTKRHLLESIQWPFLAVLIISLIHVSQVYFHWDARVFGIVPRLPIGFRGVLTAPLVHGSWGHLFNNSLPLFVLFSTIFYFYRRPALRAFLMIYVLTGIMVWMFARSSSHIGASGIVFGLFGFMLANGIFRRNNKSILLSLLILMMYGGMFLGLSNDQEGVSYESHWAGFLAGIFASFWYKEELEADELIEKKMPDPADQIKRFYMPRAIFHKTKAQRAFEEAERIRIEQERLMAIEAERRRIQEEIDRRNHGGFWDSTVS